jgi:RHS repeat-associated protein
VDRVKYGYDRAGNRIWRENVVAREQYNKPFDEIYSYDGLHRLIDFRRGWLNESRSDLTQMTFRQSWTLDATGNWSEFKEDTDGDGTWDLVQQRSCNPVNEITQITTLTGPTWATPQYDRAGNMTLIPKPADPTQTFTATYDPWNRLVKLTDTTTSNPIAEYQYDARNRRVVKRTYDDAGNLSEVRHFYFTDQWQDIEERVARSSAGSSVGPESVAAQRQLIWDRRYIDALLARERDTDGDGILDEQVYVQQDANWNVARTQLTTGEDAERYVYSPYGVPTFLTNDLAEARHSALEFVHLFAGYSREPDSAVYSVRNRIYHARLGTWTSRDPLAQCPPCVLYEYVQSMPLIFTDPEGTSAVCTLVVAGGLALLVCGCAGRTPCKDPCAEAKRRGMDRGDVGGVICCDGKKYACVWGEFPFDCFRKCSLAHEYTHFYDVECPSSGLHRPPFKPGKIPKKEECEAYRVQIRCLKYEASCCRRKFQGSQALQCEKWYRRWLASRQGWCMKYCGNPHWCR